MSFKNASNNFFKVLGWKTLADCLTSLFSFLNRTKLIKIEFSAKCGLYLVYVNEILFIHLSLKDRWVRVSWFPISI